MKNILICDDIGSMRSRWKNQLEAIEAVHDSFEVEVIGNEFIETLSALEKRRRLARQKKDDETLPPEVDWGKALFDKVDILIVDYDLLYFNQADYITGEGVAYLARCYSTCGLIVALNQFGENPFDLTLKGDPESYADLNLGSRQLTNAGLWSHPWSGFRPWSWALLPQALTDYNRRVKELLKDSNLDKPILDYLGFPGEVVATLPRSAKEFLGSGDRIDTITFREFVLNSKNGLRRKDKPLDDESIARVASARIGKWLEKLILPGQDILVDGPHLASRFPSLLKGKQDDLEALNRTTSPEGVSSVGLDYRLIQDFRFKQAEWLSRPAWFWNRLSGFNKIAEVSDPWSTSRSDFVFCEDISAFLPRQAAREFVADLPSPFVRRFVVDKDSAEGKRMAKSLAGVDYVPAVRFSL